LAGCCECGDEPSGSGAIELVSLVSIMVTWKVLVTAFVPKILMNLFTSANNPLTVNGWNIFTTGKLSSMDGDISPNM
jgi:hypothetical protein